MSSIISSVLDTLMNLTVTNFCSFTTKNYYIMEHLMRINIQQQSERIDSFGDNAMYQGNSILLNTERNVNSTVTDIDYYSTFAKWARNGKYEYTRTSGSDNVFTSYTNHNQLYSVSDNRFPNDLDVSDSKITNKEWDTSMRDSLLYKTRQLFRRNKINTLVSRFCTKSNGSSGITTTGDVTSQYGMSHGRNLLLKEAEDGYSESSYNINGYNNPYCRVWTYHYQYDKFGKLIRPLSSISLEDRANGENYTTVSPNDFHTWTNFKSDSDDSNAYGWKNGNAGWNKSVLNKNNGLVNITPKYLGGGRANIHTKDCMFSIENLAWRGYDPYSFEKALSWEQRGPMGGRIMWFPPYGIQFSETSQANWTNHSFIGRGEDVYTYTNTVRSGNLSFMMVVDHPSIIDYVSWQKGSEDTVPDTDLLRFFAGCDDGGTLSEYAKPMPLTDEYIETVEETENLYTTAQKLPPQDPVPEVPDVEKEIVFYVFFPNNYSGYYDTVGSTVEAAAYLINGSGTQKNSDNNDIKITFDELNSSTTGTGYEMVSVLSTEGEAIHGTIMSWSSAKRKGVSSYSAIMSSSIEWHYRIDGKYEIPSGTNDSTSNVEMNRNTYDQRLRYTANYTDSTCVGLNRVSSEVASLHSCSTDGLYSFAEVAAALSSETVRSFLTSSRSVDNSKVTELRDLFDNYKVVSISGEGYSNSHGNNANEQTNLSRNELLAKQRANSIVEWFKSRDDHYTSDSDTVSSETFVSNVSVTTTSISDKEAKRYRSCKMTVKLKKSSTSKLSETTQASTDADGNTVVQGTQKYVGYTTKTDSTGREYYVMTSNGSTTYWYEKTSNDKSGELVRCYIINNTITDIVESTTTLHSRGTYDKFTGESSGETNKIRYDKEYYFFKQLEAKNPLVFDKLMQKIQYFDPAFHSMTPEGFNARLTFLQQCTRQGDTVSTSDNKTNVETTGTTSTKNGTASNLAFGRPPFCVLRLGDFYNQMIVIDNIGITYEPIVWDLNTEGVGVQPMIANVTISFKFIGGGDLAGPVKRLQNAMTFNYYANARLYDNRADRVVYNWDDASNGALDHDLDTESSYFHTVAKYEGK